MRVLCLLRDSLAYRRDAFIAGFDACNFEIIDRVPHRIGRDDVMVIWNRYGGNHELARQYESNGAKVIVCENGHLGKGWRGRSWYAMALSHHAGAGTWPNGGPERWDSWNVTLAPWREGGFEYLIFAQRGIGEPGLRSPPNWAESTYEKLHRERPDMKLRIRAHPGTGKAKISLEEDLQNAAGAIAWHSAAALASLMHGVPVWYDCPSWLGREAGKPLSALRAREEPLCDDALRLSTFRNVAWAMWELEEVANGVPFRHLLERVPA